MKLNGQFHVKIIMNTLLKDWRKSAKDCASRYQLLLRNQSLNELGKAFMQNESFRLMLIEQRHQHYHKKNNLAGIVEEFSQVLKAIPQIARHVDCVSQIVKLCPQTLPLFENLANHTKVVLAILFNNPEKITTYPQFLQTGKLEMALAYNPVIYKYLPENQKNNARLAKLAISSTIFSQNSGIDRLYGMYPHLTPELKQNREIALNAIKYYPANFKNLDNNLKKDIQIIKRTLHSVFYEHQYCSYYHVQDILPHIDESYFKDYSNIKWMMRAFSKNLEETCLNTESTLIAFTTFMKKAGNQNSEVKNFFNIKDMPGYLENLIRNHNYKIYENSIPSGLEKDANDFFRQEFPRLETTFNRYLLMKKLTNMVGVQRNINNETINLEDIDSDENESVVKI
jgi:hypothetical protein